MWQKNLPEQKSILQQKFSMGLLRSGKLKKLDFNWMIRQLPLSHIVFQKKPLLVLHVGTSSWYIKAGDLQYKVLHKNTKQLEIPYHIFRSFSGDTFFFAEKIELRLIFNFCLIFFS